MKRSSLRWVGALVLSLGLTYSIAAMAKLSKTGSASGGFKAYGPAGMTIDGKSSDVGVTDDGTNVLVQVGLNSLKTGIDLRDDHTKKALESDKYPNAEFKVARGDLKFPAAGATTSGDVKGSLKIHGQAKDVTVHYDAKKDGDTITVTGSTKVNMNDFGIKTPSYLGVGVKPDVDVSISFQAKDG